MIIDAVRIEKHLRELFEATISKMVERKSRTKKQFIVPAQHFSNALIECKESFIWGQFYGTITVIQSSAEGLAKFLSEKSGLDSKFYSDAYGNASQKSRIQELRTRKIISDSCATAFDVIRGVDRNDFHHLNRSIPTDLEKFEQRAEECLQALFLIESEVFDCSIAEGGTINPKYPQYWNIKPDGAIEVYIQGSAWEY